MVATRPSAGGLFLPLRDGTAGQLSYGGGRYVLDTAKGADLGGQTGRLMVDLNFISPHPRARLQQHLAVPTRCAGNTTHAPGQGG